MTITQESSSSNFTPSTTYSSTNDPTNNSTQGMSVHNNKVNKNLFPHSIVWLFDSSGFEYEGYRVYFKSERSGYPAVYHEGTTSYLTFTLMEISQ